MPTYTVVIEKALEASGAGERTRQLSHIDVADNIAAIAQAEAKANSLVAAGWRWVRLNVLPPPAHVQPTRPDESIYEARRPCLPTLR